MLAISHHVQFIFHHAQHTNHHAQCTNHHAQFTNHIAQFIKHLAQFIPKQILAKFSLSEITVALLMSVLAFSKNKNTKHTNKQTNKHTDSDYMKLYLFCSY